MEELALAYNVACPVPIRREYSLLFFNVSVSGSLSACVWIADGGGVGTGTAESGNGVLWCSGLTETNEPERDFAGGGVDGGTADKGGGVLW